MTDDQQERLRILEVTVSEMRVRQAEIEALVRETTETANRIKVDTSEIVALIKGASVLGQIAKWLAIVIGGYLAGKGLKWW